MKISVSMIVKNEEVMLEDCLKSVKDADEIVVVDTGSTDDTINIAKKYTDKVFTDYKWRDNFAEARNHANSKCTGDWIFVIDADDRMEEGGMKKAREIIAKHPDQLAFNVNYKSNTGHRGHTIPTLHKKHKNVFYRGAAHNHLSASASIDSGITTLYGYSPAHNNDKDRTFRILKKAVDADPTKSREIFYLSREYRYRKKWVDCLYWVNEYLKLASWGPEMADAWLMKAISLWNLQKGEEARDACLGALKYNANFKEAILLMSTMTGPKNRDMWLFMAEVANNKDVLFVRQKIEKDAAYYDAVYAKSPDMSRYFPIYEEVGKTVGAKSALDIGCGQGKLSEYIENYDGFDMAKNPYRVANIYEDDYGDYDIYVLLEVLEHLTKDIEVLEKIPPGKTVLFSVPSFDDPAHIRMFTERIVRWRYRDLIKLTDVTRFNMDDKKKWSKDADATPSYILLCKGIRI